MSADLVRLVQDAPEYASPQDWPKPLEIRAPLSSVPAFDYALLPEALRGWVRDVAHRMQCCPDYAAIAAMVALGTVVGRRIQVRPKRKDDWSVVPNLWGMIIGRPSALKSPALEEMMRPLHKLESSSQQQHEDQLRLHEKAMRIHSAREKAHTEKLKQAFKKNIDCELADDLPDAPKPPPRRRLVTVDATIEKLGELLRDNPRGMLVYRDELAGWFASFDRDGRESDRTFYLTAWNGNSPFRYDRIGRGTVDIEAACVSMLGTIQPGVLIRHISEQLKGAYNDGLVQRFQMMVYPDDVAKWVYVDESPDMGAKERAVAVYRKLDEADPTLLGCELGDDDDTRVLRFDENSQDMFKTWLTTLEAKLRDTDEQPVVNEHLGKFRKLMPALASLIHVADVAGGFVQRGEIGQRATAQAIAWCQYLEAHARRIYGSALARGTTAAKLLAAKIRKGKVRDQFTSREIYMNEWSGLATPDDAMKAIETLEELGWVRGVVCKTGGRPTIKYQINPRVHETPDGGEEVES